jgi:tetratricopeptide (TPR) repeat protein
VAPAEAAADQAGVPSEDVWAILDSAQQRHQANRCEEAIPLYTRVIEAMPDLASALGGRAYCLDALDEREVAVEDYRKLLRLWPGDAQAHGALGWALIQLERFAEAQEVTQKAHQLDPINYAWAVNLGHTFLLQGDPKNARRLYEQTLALVPEDEAFRAGPLADFDLFEKRGWAVDSNQPIDMSVIYVDATYGISAEFPKAGDDNRVEPGAVLDGATRFANQKGIEISDSTAGLEHILILAEPASKVTKRDYSYLAQEGIVPVPGVRAGESELEEFLNQALWPFDTAGGARRTRAAGVGNGVARMLSFEVVRSEAQGAKQ